MKLATLPVRLLPGPTNFCRRWAHFFGHWLGFALSCSASLDGHCASKIQRLHLDITTKLWQALLATSARLCSLTLLSELSCKAQPWSCTLTGRHLSESVAEVTEASQLHNGRQHAAARRPGRGTDMSCG